MSRIQRLLKRLPEEVDGALVTSPVNRRYLTGFASSAGTLLATRQESYFIIDSRYHELARRTIGDCRVLLQDKLYDQLNELIGRHNLGRLAVEGDRMTLQSFNGFSERLPGVELMGCDALSGTLNGLRRIKDEEELRRIGEAQRIADDTFTHILDFIRPGRTEREIALEMEFYSRRMGSEGVPFDFIVVSGENSSLPHGVPTDRQVREGDLITMDFGAVVGGYCSDMTRTVAVGAVGERQREAYRTVLEAQLAALSLIRPGMPCDRVDAAARDLIDASPYAGTFGHGTGHSLGLEVHEEPRFGPSCGYALEPGVVMSVEPGVYLPGEFGVRIEDIVVLTSDGYHNFCTSPKELITL